MFVITQKSEKIRTFKNKLHSKYLQPKPSIRPAPFSLKKLGISLSQHAHDTNHIHQSVYQVKHKKTQDKGDGIFAV